mmetsp:Transcript_10851/g.29951  ORF Transcript_10851/g.29951 Transcript_10851/m.29951 type:complete len:94 (-) Transcript_10851:2037-2318(-)
MHYSSFVRAVVATAMHTRVGNHMPKMAPCVLLAGNVSARLKAQLLFVREVTHDGLWVSTAWYQYDPHKDGLKFATKALRSSFRAPDLERLIAA